LVALLAFGHVLGECTAFFRMLPVLGRLLHHSPLASVNSQAETREKVMGSAGVLHRTLTSWEAASG
jgi:hypothetical protein